MGTPFRRYFRVFRVMVTNCLVREMQFKTNFVIRVLTEFLWLGMQWVFVEVLYGQTKAIGGWDKWQMIALLGTNYIISQAFEGMFFDNCMRLTDLIRKGELDFVLVKPMNPQFLVSFPLFRLRVLPQFLLGDRHRDFRPGADGRPFRLGWDGLVRSLRVERHRHPVRPAFYALVPDFLDRSREQPFRVLLADRPILAVPLRDLPLVASHGPFNGSSRSGGDQFSGHGAL
jgi:hypothetical protein